MRIHNRPVHSLALCLALLVAWALPALAGTVRVEMMDVGQGDSILITTPAGKRVLIDGGIKQADVVDKLRQRGVTQLDLVVATHPHADHIGGLADVLAAFPVKFFTDNGLPHTTQVYTKLMQAVEDQGITYRPAQLGQSFRLDDGIVIDVLFPSGTPLTGTRSDLNANSVVLRMTHGDRCFLFTGDSEDPTETELERHGIQPCDVLKVAHHGSRYSTSDAWLRDVQPAIALISAGVDNRYGHPAPETLQRLAHAGVKIYRTDTMGDIVVTSDGHDLQVTTSRTATESPKMVATLPRRVPAQLGPRVVKPDAARAAAVAMLRRKHGKAPLVSDDQLQPGDPGCAFVSSKSSTLYHPADCYVVNRIWSGNRVCWATEAAAESAGKRRSKACPDANP